MLIEYVANSFKPGTMYRQVFLYYDDGDVMMTNGYVYEDEYPEEEDDADGDYDGPEDG
jgi:hypothetical protein